MTYVWTFVHNCYLMNLWSSVHPHQSECLLRCLGRVGRHEPAIHLARQKGYSLHALQKKGRTIFKYAEQNVHYYNVKQLQYRNTNIMYQRIYNAYCTFWSKTDHNVSVALVQLLKGQRGDIRPNVQRIADGSVHIGLLQIWCVIQYPETSGDRRRDERVNKWYKRSLFWIIQLHHLHYIHMCHFNAYLNVTLLFCHLRCRGKWLYSPMSGTPHLACFIRSRVLSSRFPVTFRGGSGGQKICHMGTCVAKVLYCQ